MQIRKQDPLKQGLKRFEFSGFNIIPDIRKQEPVKQGVKLKHVTTFNYSAWVQQDPLKQGLKQENESLCR